MTRQTRWTMVVALAALAVVTTSPAAQQATAGSPAVSVVPLPYTAGNNAIWGSTGQDSQGHIWFGISVGGITPNTARLVEYVPDTATFFDHGDVVTALRSASLLRPGEQQAKIHSKIVPGPGGYLYFSSMDEDGENEDGSKPPTWGGHLWRFRLSTGRWEHLLRVPEALIAVGAGGRYVYALGYFGHVLYQYDTQTGRTARVQIGSVDGHISRNFLVDDRGHAFVPRLVAEAGPQGRVVHVSIVELGTDLRDLRVTPIATSEYLGGESPTGAHGIVGLQTMADRSIAFTTHAGRLFRIVPPPPGPTGQTTPAEVVNMGWIHPRGPSYPASLFTSDGKGSISTLAKAGSWDWVTCTWPTMNCTAAPIHVPGFEDGPTYSMLLYGSATRDAKGGHYLVGMGPGYRPIVLRIQG
jgi:hypothetical protein